MISIRSLSDNFLPNAYIKSVVLDSVYYGKITNSKTDGYSDPEYNEQTTAAINENYFNSKLMISMKFAKTNDVQTSMMHLLGDELSEYIKIYVHQITSQSIYENMLGKNVAQALTTEYDSNHHKTQVYSFKSMTTSLGSKENGMINMPEQTLDDGTILYESLLETQSHVYNNTSFLAYVIVPAIIHPDLAGDDIPIGKVSGDIILLNKTLQNEGLAFTIATPPAGSDKTALAKFGKPGEIWAGSVHQQPNGNFMAGPHHTPEDPHPVLNYQIVPVTKYVDNRIGKKIERKILNITKAFEQMHSLTTRYKNSATNLLDYESYKKITFMSDIYLSQDRDLNINGMVSIDKLNLIKKNCAFPYIFDNIKSQSMLADLLKRATRMNLDFYENDKLLVPNETDPDFKFGPISIDGAALNDVESFVFKRKNDSISTYKYRVEVTYKDPTIEYVKSVLGIIPPAQESVDILLKRIQIRKSSAHGDNSAAGYNPITQRINKELIDELYAETNSIVNADGHLQTVRNLFFAGVTGAVLGQSSTEDLEEIRTYIFSLMKLETATIDSLLVLSSLLQNLRVQLENSLASFGSKPSKESSGSQYGNLKNQGDVDSARTNRTIKASSQNTEITIVDAGYDFIGSMLPPGKATVNGITRLYHTNYREGCKALLKQLLPLTSTATPGDETATMTIDKALVSSIYPKGIPVTTLSASAFTYLTISPWISKLKKCILLPSTVLDVNEAGISDIFYAILKYNYLLSSSRTSHLPKGTLPLGGNDLKESRKDLDTIMKQKFATYLPSTIPTNYDESTVFTALLDENDPPPREPIASEGVPTDPSPELQKNKNFLLHSLLGKLIISRGHSLMPQMTTNGFLPYSDTNKDDAYEAQSTLDIFNNALPELKEAGHADKDGSAVRFPIPVLVLSQMFNIGNNQDPLQWQNFTIELLNGVKEQYFGGQQKNVINPEKLWYYWFIHQNIVKVEYFDGYEETTDTIFLKNQDNPYGTGESKQITRRNLKKPRWKMMTESILNSFDNNTNKLGLFCRVTRYNYPYYIDKSLVKSLDLPLIDNYFIIERGN